MTDQGDSAGCSVLSAVQEALIAADSEGKKIPQLADKWEMSPDGKVITFYLHKGIQFHDGWGEFTSQDVKFTLEKMITEKASINTVSAYVRDVVDSIETPDPYTVVLKMKKVSIDFFAQILPPFTTFASKKYVESVGRDQATKRPIGTGSWKFVEYKEGDYVKFEAVENHWRRTPEFKYLVIKEVPDSASRVMMLRAGEVDLIGLPLASVAEVEKAGFKILTSKGHPWWLFFGGLWLPTRETFKPEIPWVGKPNDPASLERALKVRKAINLAIDREKILATVLRGKGSLEVLPWYRSDMPGWDPKWKPYPYDPEQAKKLLAEAGYAKGFTIGIRLYTMPGREEFPDVGEAVGMYLKQIGLDVKLLPQDYNNVFRPELAARKMYDLALYGYSLDEAITGWNRAGRAGSIVPMMGEHPWLEEKMTKAGSELDPAKRAKMQTEIGQWLIDNYWTIPIASKDFTFGANPKKVKDWKLTPLMTYSTGWEYVERAP